MHIAHIGIWVKDLESCKKFYTKYFACTPSALYHNPKTGFKSYFLKFNNGASLEIMSKSDISAMKPTPSLGLAHISISLGSKEKVDELTEIFRKDGYKIVSEPRTTGDGYYESVIADVENNLVELTV